MTGPARRHAATGPPTGLPRETTTASPAQDPTVRGARAASVAACIATAVAFGSALLLGLEDPVAMPTTPRWVTVVAAAATAVLVAAASGHGGLRRYGPAASSAAVMLAGSLLALPHTILMVIISVGQLFTDAGGPFTVALSWPATLAHGLNLVAASLVALWILVDRRRQTGRCPRCGRLSAEPGPTRRRNLWVPALLAAAAALPYGLLKLAWSLGADVGLTGDAFADVTAGSAGFGDTVVLTALSLLASLAMGTGVRVPALRWALTAVGVGGALMLLPVGVTAAVQLVPVLWGGGAIDDSQIAPWAFGLVYASFLVWGLALAWLTVAYWRATRPRCRKHTGVRAPAAPS